MNTTIKESLVLSHVTVAAGVPFSHVKKSKVLSSCNERGLVTKSVTPVLNSLIKKGLLVKGNIGGEDSFAITPLVYSHLM